MQINIAYSLHRFIAHALVIKQPQAAHRETQRFPPEEQIPRD